MSLKDNTANQGEWAKNMFDILLRHLEEVASGESNPKFSEDEVRRAVLILLCRVVIADGLVLFEEIEKLEAIVTELFGSEAMDWQAILSDIDADSSQSEPIFATTQILLRALGEEDRQDLVGRMWAIAATDGDIHPDECKLIERVANLLKVGMPPLSPVSAGDGQ